MAEDFEKIKRNVIKMLSQNAPEADVDAYLQSEKLTADEFATVAKGKAKLGDIRMTQQSQAAIAQAAPSENAWDKYQREEAPKYANRKSNIFPMSTDAQGNMQWDPSAGILGSLISGVTAPGDVATGKLDPQSPEGEQRATEAALLATPMGAGVKSAETTIPGTLRSLRLGAAEAPTAQALKEAGASGLELARKLGVDYSADAVKSMGDELTQALTNAGFFPEVAPKTFSLLSRISEVPGVGAGEQALSSLDNLVTLRKSLQKAAGDVQNPTEQAAAARAIDAVDDFISKADPQSVVAGPASSAGPILEDARGNYAAAMRSNKVTDTAADASRSAEAANSGLNVGNRTRQAFNSILKSDKQSRGFSKEELAQMDLLARGKGGINAARYASNALGGGGGLGAQVTGALGGAVGGAVGGFPGMGVGAVLAPAAGYALKKLENSLTQRQVKLLDEAIRKRSPLFMSQDLPVTSGMSPEVRSAVERALLLGGLGMNQQ